MTASYTTRVAVAEIRHAAPRLAVDALEPAGVKAGVVELVAPAGGTVARPALAAKVGVVFLLAAAHVVVDRVGIHLHAARVRRLDERDQLRLVPEPGLDAAALIELAQVEVVERVVPHRRRAGRLAARGQPQRREPGVAQLVEARRDVPPPLVLDAGLARTIPVERLQQHAHRSKAAYHRRHAVASPAASQVAPRSEHWNGGLAPSPRGRAARGRSERRRR